MIYDIKLLPETKIDLSEAKNYYLKKGGENLAKNFKKEVNAEIAYIQKFPQHYQIQYRNLRRALIRRFPYAIFYRVEKKLIIIFAVLHTSQDFKRITNRL